jgi:hypothetical protein
MSDEQAPEVNPAAELAAMNSIATALAALPKPAQVRVLRWAGDLYGAGISAIAPRTIVSGKGELQAGSALTSASGSSASTASKAVGDFAALAEFYSAANPSSDMLKALVVAYWQQMREGRDDFDTQSVNTELKHLGFGVSNITRAFEQLKATKPQLVMQLRKEGNTQQARKRFKVTVEGQRAVERMLAAAP